MRGFAETNHHRRTGWKTPEECYNGASTWAVPSLAPKFSVKKNETALPALVSGFRVVPERERPLGLQTRDTEPLSRHVSG